MKTKTVTRQRRFEYAVGCIVKSMRLNARLTRKQLAKKAHFPEIRLTAIEDGSADWVALSELTTIAQAVGRTLLISFPVDI